MQGIKICNTFNAGQREIIDQALNTAQIPDNLLRLDIENNGRMRSTAGRALSKLSTGQGVIKMNKRLFNTTCGLVEFKETFTHELAHIMANFRHKKQCGHGVKWVAEHKKLGGKAARCHDYMVNHLKAKRQMFKYKCDCMQHEIGVKRHNKIQRKVSIYRCAKCKGALREA